MSHNKINEVLVKGMIGKKQSTSTAPVESEEEAEQLRDALLKKFSKRNPKATTKDAQVTRSGKFYFDVEYNKETEADDKSVVGHLKRGIGAGVKAVKTVKDAISSIPKKGIIRGKNSSLLGKERAKILAKYPDANFLKIRTDEDGLLIQQYIYTVKNKEQEKPKDKEDIKSMQPEQTNGRISNIQKQISKLSEPNLKNLESWLVKLNNQEVKRSLTK